MAVTNWGRSYKITFGTPEITPSNFYQSGSKMPGITPLASQYIPSNAISISNLEVDNSAKRGFHFSLSTKRKLSEKSKDAETSSVTLYNISPTMVALLHKKYCILQVEAGYNEKTALIYKGFVVDILVSRTSTDVAYKIVCKDSAIDTTKAKCSVNIPEKYNAKEALTTLSSLFPTVSSPLVYASFLEEKYAAGGFCFDGKVSSEMERFCKQYKLVYALQNGKMVLLPKNLVQGSKDYNNLVGNNYNFSEDNLKSVTKTKTTKSSATTPEYKNVTIKTYLVPFSFSQVFTLPVSDYYEMSGTFRPKTIAYSLDSRGSDWDVIIEGSPL